MVIANEDVQKAVNEGQVGLVQQKAALLPWKIALANASFLVEWAAPPK